MRHAISCAVNFYNAGVVTQSRGIGSCFFSSCFKSCLSHAVVALVAYSLEGFKSTYLSWASHFCYLQFGCQQFDSRKFRCGKWNSVIYMHLD
jgi:hypothetical protein